jgi:hypothetical protein
VLVDVDEPRQQGSVTEVDDLTVGAPSRTWSYGANAPSLDLDQLVENNLT